MKNQVDKRKKLIAKIHIAKAQLGLDDDVYRALLNNATGLSSCSKMTDTQLEKVITVLKDKGFQDNYPMGHMPMHLVQHRPMMNKIAVLLKETNKTWGYVDGMAKNMFNKDKLLYLNSEELHKLVSALQIYANRRKETL